MFQDNPLLAQLKQTLHENTPRVEGTVKGTEKGYGFLEVDAQKSYFISPPQMKKVMPGDRITATLQINNNKESAEPETLIEPFLHRFVGRIQKKADKLTIVPDHPLLRDAIPCRPIFKLNQPLNEGDWVIAELKHHPLKNDRGFFAELTGYITHSDDHLAPWWVTLARLDLGRHPPELPLPQFHDNGSTREDLSGFPFVTIDSASTEDMDDALYSEKLPGGHFQLTIAIADPTAWIAEDSELDKVAAQRAFTNYLPGFNIPMLPRELSDNLCSLRPLEKRPVLACTVQIDIEGNLVGETRFFTAWIESKAKLVYDHVSDWVEQNNVEAKWQPENAQIAEQISLLHQICLARHHWRTMHALVFKDRPDYKFVLGEKGEVVDIVIEPRRIANRMVEEAMITANIAAAEVLKQQAGFGIFNVHEGFDETNAEQAAQVLNHYGMAVSAAEIATFEGFKSLRRQMNSLPNQFLDSRIRRYQSFAEISTTPNVHAGMGLNAYATWTSPIRKYGDMINHRILKAIMTQHPTTAPNPEIAVAMSERRKQHRMAERDVSDWLYARYLASAAATDKRFKAEIFDISRGGMRVRLLENGAAAFIPASFIHAVRDELVCSQESGSVLINGIEQFRVSHEIEVTIAEVRMATRSIVARPVS